MKKSIVAGVASVAILGLTGCVSGEPNVEFDEPRPTPTETETFTPEPLSDIEKGVDGFVGK